MAKLLKFMQPRFYLNGKDLADNCIFLLRVPTNTNIRTEFYYPYLKKALDQLKSQKGHFSSSPSNVQLMLDTF